jgi:hypothetical protein
MFTTVQECVDRFVEKEDLLTRHVMRTILAGCERRGSELCERIGSRLRTRKGGGGDSSEAFQRGYDYLMQTCPRQPLLYHVVHNLALKANGATVLDVDQCIRDKASVFRRYEVSSRKLFLLETHILDTCDWKIYDGAIQDSQIL